MLHIRYVGKRSLNGQFHLIPLTRDKFITLYLAVFVPMRVPRSICNWVTMCQSLDVGRYVTIWVVHYLGRSLYRQVTLHNVGSQFTTQKDIVFLQRDVTQTECCQLTKCIFVRLSKCNQIQSKSHRNRSVTYFLNLPRQSLKFISSSWWDDI